MLSRLREISCGGSEVFAVRPTQFPESLPILGLQFHQVVITEIPPMLAGIIAPINIPLRICRLKDDESKGLQMGRLHLRFNNKL